MQRRHLKRRCSVHRADQLRHNYNHVQGRLLVDGRPGDIVRVQPLRAVENVGVLLHSSKDCERISRTCRRLIDQQTAYLHLEAHLSFVLPEKRRPRTAVKLTTKLVQDLLHCRLACSCNVCLRQSVNDGISSQSVMDGIPAPVHSMCTGFGVQSSRSTRPLIPATADSHDKCTCVVNFAVFRSASRRAVASSNTALSVLCADVHAFTPGRPKIIIFQRSESHFLSSESSFMYFKTHDSSLRTTDSVGSSPAMPAMICPFKSVNDGISSQSMMAYQVGQ